MDFVTEARKKHNAEMQCREAKNKKVIKNVQFGKDVKVWDFVNLYDCKIDDYSKIGAFVEIQRGVIVGKRCAIQSHSFICDGVTIEDDVFIGHGVMFINDRNPEAHNPNWKKELTLIKKGASIGSGVTIMCGITIGKYAKVGAGSVVIENVPDGAVVFGNPARMKINGRTQ